MFPRIFTSLLLLAFAESMMLTPGTPVICEAPSMLMKESMCSGNIYNTKNILCVVQCRREGFDDGECKELQCICKKDCTGLIMGGNVPSQGASSNGVNPGQSPPNNSGGNIVALGPSSGGINPFQAPPIIGGGYDPAQGPSRSDATLGQGSPSGNDPGYVGFIIPNQGSPSESGGNNPAQDPYVGFVIPIHTPPMESDCNDPAQDPTVNFVIPNQAPPMEFGGNNPTKEPTVAFSFPNQSPPMTDFAFPNQSPPSVEFVIPNQAPPMEFGGNNPTKGPTAGFTFPNQSPPMVNFDFPNQGPPMEGGVNNLAQAPSNHGIDPVKVAQAPSSGGDYLGQGPPREGVYWPLDHGYDGYGDDI